MNFVLAIVLTWGLYMVGVPIPAYSHQPVQVAGVIPKSPAEKAGIRAGDRIVSIDGTKVADWDAAFANPSILPGQLLNVDVERNGAIVPLNVQVPQQPGDGFDVLGCPKERVAVDSVSRGDPAARPGPVSARGHLPRIPTPDPLSIIAPGATHGSAKSSCFVYFRVSVVLLSRALCARGRPHHRRFHEP